MAEVISIIDGVVGDYRSIENLFPHEMQAFMSVLHRGPLIPKSGIVTPRFLTGDVLTIYFYHFRARGFSMANVVIDGKAVALVNDTFVDMIHALKSSLCNEILFWPERGAYVNGFILLSDAMKMITLGNLASQFGDTSRRVQAIWLKFKPIFRFLSEHVAESRILSPDPSDVLLGWHTTESVLLRHEFAHHLQRDKSLLSIERLANSETHLNSILNHMAEYPGLTMLFPEYEPELLTIIAEIKSNRHYLKELVADVNCCEAIAHQIILNDVEIRRPRDRMMNVVAIYVCLWLYEWVRVILKTENHRKQLDEDAQKRFALATVRMNAATLFLSNAALTYAEIRQSMFEECHATGQEIGAKRWTINLKLVQERLNSIELHRSYHKHLVVDIRKAMNEYMLFYERYIYRNRESLGECAEGSAATKIANRIARFYTEFRMPATSKHRTLMRNATVVSG